MKPHDAKKPCSCCKIHVFLMDFDKKLALVWNLQIYLYTCPYLPFWGISWYRNAWNFSDAFHVKLTASAIFFASRSCDAARFDQSWSKLKRIARDSRRVSMEVVADSLGIPSSIKSCNKVAPCDVHHATTSGPVFMSDSWLYALCQLHSDNLLCSFDRLPHLDVTPASHKRCAKLSGLSGCICWAAASSNGISKATRLSQAIWRAKPVAAKAKPWSLSFAVCCRVRFQLVLGEFIGLQMPAWNFLVFPL